MNRRTMLRGLGATIALPLFESMGGRTLAATAGKADPPRLACFFIPGGISRSAWFPEDTGFNYTLASSHKPLERFRDQFSVLTGLSHIQGRITGHVHPYNWLTGHNINLTPGAITNTVSMDQVAANHLGPTYLRSMTLSWKDGVGTATLARNSLGVDIPATADYRTVFERLFPPADSTQIKEAQSRMALDRSILDTAVGSVKGLQRKLGYADRQRLDQYLEAVRHVEQRLVEKEDILDHGRPEIDEGSVRLEPQGKNSMREHIDLMMDLIALAFQTDMTRVVTQVLGGEAGPNYGEYIDWAKTAGAQTRGTHDYHHKGSQARGLDDPDVQVLTYRDEMLSGCLARLMEKLQSIEADDGTLLDHSVLLFGGSQINSHSGHSFPTVLAGGGKLGFRHGQHVKWDADTVPMSNLYLTILQQLGCPVQSFKESSGIISEVLA
ncbi:DUF1552 domain-containing protein [soil metagenome]